MLMLLVIVGLIIFAMWGVHAYVTPHPMKIGALVVLTIVLVYFVIKAAAPELLTM